MKFNRYIEDEEVMLAYDDNIRKCILTRVHWKEKVFLVYTDQFRSCV